MSYKQIRAVATQEQIEEVLGRTSFDAQTVFIKNLITPEQLEAEYGPFPPSDDPIRNYMWDAWYRDFHIVHSICRDMGFEAEFHDWILDFSKTGYNSYGL